MFTLIKSLRKLIFATVALLPSAGFAQGFDIEPNNPCAAAQDIGLPTLPYNIMGSLDTIGGLPDIDFYRFEGIPGEFVRADYRGETTGVGTLGDPLLGLFDDDCNLITLNDDAVSLDSRLLFAVPASGAYILAATAFPDFQFEGLGEGSYLLTLSAAEFVGSISGRLVSARDGSPLPGDGPTAAFAQLFRCVDDSCFEFVGIQSADADGNFRFEFDISGIPLLTGSYQIQAIANGFEFLATEIFEVSESQALDLGNIAMTPFSTIGSVRGRLVDAIDGSPLSGFGPPFASVLLERCEEFGCFGVAGAQPDEQGRFLFFGAQNFLSPGQYRVSAFADSYQPVTSSKFDVDEFEDFNLGDIGLTPVPIQFGNVHGCDIPPGGGLCEFGIELTNRGPKRFKGEAWSTIDFAPNVAPFRTSRFQVGKVGTNNPMPDKLNIRSGQSVTLSFQLDVPGDLPEFSTFCASATVGRNPSPQFQNFGDRFLFCAVTQSGQFTVLPEKEGRKQFRKLRNTAAGTD